MNPQAAWTEIVSHYTADRSDWSRLEELADGLSEWLQRDGFSPCGRYSMLSTVRRQPDAVHD